MCFVNVYQFLCACASFDFLVRGGIGIYIDIYLYEVNAKHISSNVLEVSEISRAHSKRLKGLQFQHM